MARADDAKIAAVQAVAWRKLGAAGRVRVAADLSDNTRRAAAEKIRQSNPSWSEDDVRRALAKALYGETSAPPSETRKASASIMLEDALSRLIAIFACAGVPYMLTGCLASTAHGVPRATTDLDIVIDPPPGAMAHLVEALAAGGWSVEASSDPSHLVVVDEAAAWKVDLVVRKDRPFSIAEFARREEMDVLGLLAWVASAEDTVLAKLEHARDTSDAPRRGRQLRDAAGVVASRGASLDRAYVERWVAELGLEHEWRQAAAITP